MVNEYAAQMLDPFYKMDCHAAVSHVTKYELSIY